MNKLIVRYKVKGDKASENQKYIQQVFAELHKIRPAGLRYASFKLSDGVSFVHIVSVETADGNNPLIETPGFKLFNEGIKDRCEEQPVLTEIWRRSLTEIRTTVSGILGWGRQKR